MMNDGQRDIPFIFPKQVCHISMVGAMRGLEENFKRTVFWTLVGAGFVNLMTCECFGESESCKEHFPESYKSREVDTFIVMLYQWQHGVFDPDTAKVLCDALLKGKE